MSSKILVVDDEKPIRELLRHKLSLLGFEVVTAKNEKEFSKSVTNKPDLIILDIWLKNKIGTDIYNNLLESGFDPKVPVIFITALIEGFPKEASFVEGKKYALYSKPFDFEKLAAEVKSLLSQRETESSDSSQIKKDNKGGTDYENKKQKCA